MSYLLTENSEIMIFEHEEPTSYKSALTCEDFEKGLELSSMGLGGFVQWDTPIGSK